ncbi:MAG TPA: TolC family protein [Burkholderiales bacterium]|nr:TolC family protein [Burkholderiales bacterium]
MRRLVAAAIVLLGGCASLSEDAGFSDVEKAVQERAGVETKWVRSEDEASTVRGRLEELLAKPLGPQEAVQVALLNNPGLQAGYAGVGIAEADLVQASRWRGPTFSFARLRRGDEIERERSVFFDVLGLITIPLSVRGEEARFAAAKSRAASEGLRVALETRKAWFTAVSARESARYAEQVKEAAEASAELARRMAAVGNWPKLNLAREQAFYAEATAQLARARQAESSARERLARLMGLWGEDLSFQLPERLPELPQAPREFGTDLEAQALAQRLDVQAARRDTEALARSLGLTRVTRFVSLLEFGLMNKSETGQEDQRGWEIEIGIPIFDFGTARTARAERLYMQSVNRVAEAAIQARSEVRDAYTAYRTNFDVARHYRDEIVPLRKRISEEMVLRYNGMLASVFELLADSREQVAAVNAYIETLRDFWMAESDFQMALTGRSPGAMQTTRSAAPAAAPSGGGH